MLRLNQIRILNIFLVSIITLLATNVGAGQPQLSQFVIADESRSLHEALIDAPFESRELFMQIYGLDYRLASQATAGDKDTPSLADEHTREVLSAIVQDWWKYDTKTFVESLNRGVEIYTLWEKVPRDHRTALDKVLKSNFIDLSDGFDGNELLLSHIAEQQIADACRVTKREAIRVLTQMIHPCLKPIKLFWGKLLKDSLVENRSVLLLQIDHLTIVSEPFAKLAGNNGREVFFPPVYAYDQVQLKKALVHQVGALWGLPHNVNVQAESVFENWEKHSDSRSAFPKELLDNIKQYVGGRSLDRH